MSNPATQFKPGQSGNPGGKLKGTVSLTRLLKAKLAEGENAADLIAATLEQAKGGNPAAMKILWDRMEGPVIQKVELDDISALTPDERLKRLDQLANAGRARAAGSVAAVDPEDGD